MKKVIFIASTSYSGSTLIDLILSNNEKGFSLGEINFFFNPEQPHHLTPRCACGRPTCRIWLRARQYNKDNFYKEFFKENNDIDYVVDSSKDPFWISNQIKILKKYNIGYKIILIWKTPHEIAASFSKRSIKERWPKHWLNYHRLLSSLLEDEPIKISLDKLLNDPVAFRKLFHELDLQLKENQKDFWDKEHHTLFGNRSARRHLNIVESLSESPTYTDNSKLKTLYQNKITNIIPKEDIEKFINSNKLIDYCYSILRNNDSIINLKKLRFSNFQLIIRFLKKYYIFIKLIPSYLKVGLNMRPVTLKKQRKNTISFLVPSHLSGHVGGAEYQAYLIINTLKKYNQEMDISYYCRVSDLGYESNTHSIYICPKIPILSKYAYFFDIPFLLINLIKNKPKLIYQRDGGAYTAAAVIAKLFINTKVIFHVAHDKDLLNSLELNTLNPLKYIDRLLLKYSIKKCDFIVTQTEKQKTLLKKNFNIESNLVQPNAHPLPIENEHYKKDDPQLILWVANSTENKRMELFVRLAKDLKYTNYKFVMIGKTRSEDANLLQKIKDLPNIDHLGDKPFDEVNIFMSKATIFVNTSLSEGFPNTFIQAWMRYTPVFSLNVDPDGALKKSIAGQVTNNLSELGTKICETISNKDLLLKLQHSSRDHAIKSYSTSSFKPLINIFNENI